VTLKALNELPSPLARLAARCARQEAREAEAHPAHSLGVVQKGRLAELRQTGPLGEVLLQRVEPGVPERPGLVLHREDEQLAQLRGVGAPPTGQPRVELGGFEWIARPVAREPV
jgi:hypothetical protein